MITGVNWCQRCQRACADPVRRINRGTRRIRVLDLLHVPHTSSLRLRLCVE